MDVLKGVAAVFAGLIVVIVADTGTDFIMRALGIFSQGFDATWMVLTATIYRSLFNIAGGYVTAVVAPPPKMRYVVILGVIGTILAIVGIFAAISYDLR